MTGYGSIFVMGYVRKICSSIIDYRQNALMLASHFIRRGYPPPPSCRNGPQAQLQDRDALISKNLPEDSNPSKKTLVSPADDTTSILFSEYT